MKTLANPADRQALEERIARLSPSVPPLWGQMNANQMICHLADSLRVAIGEKTVSPASLHFPRTLARWFALYVPIPWPKGVSTRPEVKQGVGGTPPTQFSRDRAVLLQLIERFCHTTERAPHPMFRSMCERDWLRWAYLHIDHHLRQFGV